MIQYSIQSGRKRYSNTTLNDNVDFVKLAESLGAKGIRVTKKEEVADAIREAIALNAPVVIDCQIDSDDKVFPMVAPGAAISEAFITFLLDHFGLKIVFFVSFSIGVFPT